MSETTVAIKQAVDEKAREIIGLVNDFGKMHYNTIIGTQDGKRQFTDLVEAANQACCIDEFILYVKYKASKDDKKKFWAILAPSLNSMIDGKLMGITPKIEEYLQESNFGPKVSTERIKLELLKRFCGYLMWREHTDISERGGR